MYARLHPRTPAPTHACTHARLHTRTPAPSPSSPRRLCSRGASRFPARAPLLLCAGAPIHAPRRFPVSQRSLPPEFPSVPPSCPPPAPPSLTGEGPGEGLPGPFHPFDAAKVLTLPHLWNSEKAIRRSSAHFGMFLGTFFGESSLFRKNHRGKRNKYKKTQPLPPIIHITDKSNGHPLENRSQLSVFHGFSYIHLSFACCFSFLRNFSYI